MDPSLESLERKPLVAAPKPLAMTLKTKARTTATLSADRWRDNALACAFLAPSLLLFGIFLFYPLAQSMYLSVHLTDPRGRIASFVGLDNYVSLLRSPCPSVRLRSFG
jgi:sn-glycerol 3-phosphate transport system permease protein